MLEKTLPVYSFLDHWVEIRLLPCVSLRTAADNRMCASVQSLLYLLRLFKEYG